MTTLKTTTSPVRCPAETTADLKTTISVSGAPTLSSSGVGGPAQALELAAETLTGPALPADAHHPRPGPRHDRRAVVHVAGRGGGSSDPRLDRPRDLDDALAICDEGLHPIACANLGRRLCRRPVHEDVAALAQPRRERAGFHEAHRAQPAVDARLVGGAAISHAIYDPTGRGGVAPPTAACRGSPNAGPDFPPGNKKAGPLKVRLERVSQTGRGERSQTDPGDLNVPLALSCELIGRERWLKDAG